jgi:hypothetical protein
MTNEVLSSPENVKNMMNGENWQNAEQYEQSKEQQQYNEVDNKLIWRWLAVQLFGLLNLCLAGAPQEAVVVLRI